MKAIFFLVLATVALALPASAQEWTPEFGMQFKNVGSPAISPDGSMVAFTVSEALMEGEKSEHLTHIWMAAVDGSWNPQFTFGEKSATSPSFSPGGRWLAFSTSRSGDSQIWVLPVHGCEARS